MAALPIGLAEACVLIRDVFKDQVISLADVSVPPHRLSDKLWHEQAAQWPHSLPASAVPMIP